MKSGNIENATEQLCSSKFGVLARLCTAFLRMPLRTQGTRGPVVWKVEVLLRLRQLPRCRGLLQHPGEEENPLMQAIGVPHDGAKHADAQPRSSKVFFCSELWPQGQAEAFPK